jgi:hypothetical protein
MNELKESICEELAGFINDKNIQCIVMNGIDPDSGEVGRDLDVYVPKNDECAELASYFQRLALKYGARWIIQMHPIWGDRTVAVWEEDYFYFELHIVSSVNLGPVVATDILPAKGSTGPYGFIFSPWLSLFKQVINKNSRAILAGRRIWEVSSPGKFILSCPDFCQNGSGPLSLRNERFINALLGEDNDENIIERRSGLLSVVLHSLLSHPLHAVDSQVRSIYRKFATYFSPCAPVVMLHTNSSVLKLQKSLEDRIGGIFPRILVSESMNSWAFRRKMQSHQQLFVFVSRDAKGKQLNADLKLDTISSSDEVDIISSSVMDAMLDVNNKWSINASPK